MTRRSSWLYLVGVIGSVAALSAASGSCTSDDGRGGNGGSGGNGGGAGASSSGSSVDCACSCEEDPENVFFCTCPDQLNMDCCPDDAEPLCSAGLDAVCVGPLDSQHGWYCPCADLTVPLCPSNVPPSCLPGTLLNDPSDDTWSCGGCDANAIPSCPDGCPICLDGESWACSDPGPNCPGTGGSGGAGGGGGAGGAGGA